MTKTEVVNELKKQTDNAEKAMGFVRGDAEWTHFYKGRMTAFELAMEIVEKLED